MATPLVHPCIHRPPTDRPTDRPPSSCSLFCTLSPRSGINGSSRPATELYAACTTSYVRAPDSLHFCHSHLLARYIRTYIYQCSPRVAAIRRQQWRRLAPLSQYRGAVVWASLSGGARLLFEWNVRCVGRKGPGALSLSLSLALQCVASSPIEAHTRMPMNRSAKVKRSRAG